MNCLSPLLGINFGVEKGALTDACFPVFSAMPKLRYLLLDGNAGINGSGLSALQNCRLDLLTLNHTGLNDAGIMAAAAIPKLSHIQIDHTAVTYEGLLAIAGNSRIEPVAHEQFTREQMEDFFKLQREKAKKLIVFDKQAVEVFLSIMAISSAIRLNMVKVFIRLIVVTVVVNQTS